MVDRIIDASKDAIPEKWRTSEWLREWHLSLDHDAIDRFAKGIISRCGIPDGVITFERDGYLGINRHKISDKQYDCLAQQTRLWRESLTDNNMISFAMGIESQFRLYRIANQ